MHLVVQASLAKLNTSLHIWWVLLCIGRIMKDRWNIQEQANMIPPCSLAHLLGRPKSSSQISRRPNFECFNPGAGELVEAQRITKSTYHQILENGRECGTNRTGRLWYLIECPAKPSFVRLKAFLCQTEKRLFSSGSGHRA